MILLSIIIFGGESVFNVDVRTEMRRFGFYGYEVAQALGISESTFSRQLSRREFSPEQKSHILKTIEQMSERRDRLAQQSD